MGAERDGEMRGYSAERKAAVLGKLLPPRSLSVREWAREEGISDVTLYHWRKQAMAMGEMGVVEKKAPETWSGEAKLAVVVEAAPLPEVELSQYWRERGLYSEQVKAWRQGCMQGSRRRRSGGRKKRCRPARTSSASVSWSGSCGARRRRWLRRRRRWCCEKN